MSISFLVLGSVIAGLALLVLYYFLLTRAVLQMLRHDANPVLMTFSFLALIPVPPLLILGIVVMVIWSIHQKTRGIDVSGFSALP